MLRAGQHPAGPPCLQGLAEHPQTEQRGGSVLPLPPSPSTLSTRHPCHRLDALLGCPRRFLVLGSSPRLWVPDTCIPSANPAPCSWKATVLPPNPIAISKYKTSGSSSAQTLPSKNCIFQLNGEKNSWLVPITFPPARREAASMPLAISKWCNGNTLTFWLRLGDKVLHAAVTYTSL